MPVQRFSGGLLPSLDKLADLPCSPGNCAADFDLGQVVVGVDGLLAQGVDLLADLVLLFSTQLILIE